MKLFLVYLCDFYQYARYKLGLSIFLTVLLGLMEGVGIVMLIPLLYLTGILPGTEATQTVSILLGDWLRQSESAIKLPLVLLIYMAIIIGQSWLQRCQSRIGIELQQGYLSLLSLRLFTAIVGADWSFFLSRKKSDMAHVLTGELARVSNGTHFFLQLIATIVLGLIQVTLALLIAPGLTLLVLVGGMIFFFILQPYVKASRSMGISISDFNRQLFFKVNEHLQGIKEVKSCGLAAQQVNEFSRYRQEIKNNFVTFHALQTQTDMLYKTGAAVFLSLFVYCATEIFHLPPQEFVLLVVILSRLWPRFSNFQSALQHVMIMLPGLQAVLELEQACQQQREAGQLAGNAEQIHLQQGIEFRQVAFAYRQLGTAQAVQDVSFFLPAGGIYAFAGSSGAGKSTIADLLMGLLVPQQGEILMDGVPCQARLQAWRQSIGYVPQEAFLFNATIRENLTWACPQASELQIWETLKLSAVDDFVRGLPEGLDTVVGDRGGRLSGGERQRLVLARALLRRPTVLILDEATSSLDPENEAKIQQAIEGLHGKLTILVIAHRPATLQAADQIYVLDQGRIVEQGTYYNLLANQNSRFSALICLATEVN